MKILDLEQIKKVLLNIDIIPAIEAGLRAYSEGNAVIPAVAEMLFDELPGDAHIKYGYLRDDEFYVIKIASDFYDNPTLGLSSSNGLNLLFNQKTGQLKCILLDEGHLTNIRTAAAGAVAAKYLAPKKVERIGILGAGIQAKLQLQYLKNITKCKDVIVADSISQCLQRGEIFHAIQNKCIQWENLLELGNIISGKSAGRTSENQITIADLTGITVQDIQISKAVYNAI